MDNASITPFWVVRLRASSSERLNFLLRLHELGLVSFRRCIRCQVGPNVVSKKSWALRLIVDASLDWICRRSRLTLAIEANWMKL